MSDRHAHPHDPDNCKLATADDALREADEMILFSRQQIEQLEAIIEARPVSDTVNDTWESIELNAPTNLEMELRTRCYYYERRIEELQTEVERLRPS